MMLIFTTFLLKFRRSELMEEVKGLPSDSLAVMRVDDEDGSHCASDPEVVRLPHQHYDGLNQHDQQG